jgi:hypothetical protein
VVYVSIGSRPADPLLKNLTYFVGASLMTVACCRAQSLLMLSDGLLACLGAACEVRAGFG